MNIMNGDRSIEVPEILLKSLDLLSSAKLVWITLLLDTDLEPRVRHSKTRLAERTSLSRPTIYKALAALKAGGWYSEEIPYHKGMFPGRSISICIDLFLNKTLSIRARLFQGLLQLTSGFMEKARKFAYSSLSKELHMGVNSVRESVRQLVKNGWLVVEQVNLHAPIFFSLCNPIKEQFKIMKARAERNLSKARFMGEALMKEFITLIVDRDGYMDNSKPNFLINPETDSLMEFDRYYPNEVAFEFNGNQHYTPTELFDSNTVEKQRSRDAIKENICIDRGIELVVIHSQDLTLAGMQRKIGNLLPLRDLHGAGHLIRFLERISTNYRRKVPGLGQ